MDGMMAKEKDVVFWGQMQLVQVGLFWRGGGGERKWERSKEERGKIKVIKGAREKEGEKETGGQKKKEWREGEGVKR